MSLTLALNNALTGLQVNQRTMALISNNIANANTEGYSRQVVNLESVTYDGIGGGVRIADITRKVDEYLQLSVYRQTSSVGMSGVISDYYDSLQTLLGDPSLDNSIDQHIENFFNDLQQMAETPERSSTRAAVIASGQAMAREISQLALGLEQLRFQADDDLSASLDALNQKMEELYFTNESIAEAHAFGSPTATLLDKRDALLEDISQYIDIRVNERENETVDVYAGNGLGLIDFGYSRFEYDNIATIDDLYADNEIQPIKLQNVDGNGDPLGQAINIVSGGRSSEVEARFNNGKLLGLLAVRDEIIPKMLEQLDTLAGQIRDAFNAIHNQGSGYPPADELVGTAAYDVSERSSWTGGLVRIAALNEDGTPVASSFTDEVTGFRPLNMDLTQLYSGGQQGEVDLQTIIDEINNHFGIPQNRLQIGNFNNVQLALESNTTPGATPGIDFDFDIENISATDGEFWLEDVQVFDDTGANITSTSNTLPSIALNGANTYSTTALSTTVTITTAANHGLSNGDMVRLFDPGGPVDGIPGVDFDGYFVVSNVTANTFEITVANPAAIGTSVSVAGQTAVPPYDTVLAGEKTRLQAAGSVHADLSGNPSSAYYDVNVEMYVRDGNGNLTSTIVTYRVLNNQTDTMNDRISARAVVAGAGVLTIPTDNRPLLRALLVDEDGNTLPDTAGSYGEQRGYLKIESMRDGVTFVIDDVGTEHLGLPTDSPPRDGDGRGFSYHFGLNNFFTNNELTETGDTVKNSALHLAVEQRLLDNPSLISTGNLQRSNQPGSPTAAPLYTYELYSGDHSVAQQLAALGFNPQHFQAAGGLPETDLSFNSYAAEMLGYISANSISANTKADNDQVLLDGYIERADAVSGVNLDEELANTIIYQNAYAASARVISVTDELFQTLLNAF